MNTMKKLQIFGLALVAVFAFGAVAAMSASAAEAVFCSNTGLQEEPKYLTSSECLKMEKPQPIGTGNPS